MTNVIKLELVEVGEGFRFDGDEILEVAKGNGLNPVAVIGEHEDGSIWVSGSASAGEVLVLMERAKRMIVFGEE